MRYRSWVHHFRGSIRLLEAAKQDPNLDDDVRRGLSQLLEKQAVCDIAQL